jgi:kynurenine formamidase
MAEVMLFRTGGNSLSMEIVDELAESETVTVVGTDHLKVGDQTAHKLLLSNDVYVIENLTNLERPPEFDGYAHIYAMIIDGCDDGAPVSVAFEPGI